MKKELLAHFALFFVNIIYGAGFSIAKIAMDSDLPPFAFISIRIIGSALLFWMLAIFIKGQKIAKRDYLRLAICGLFGVAINQSFFIWGLDFTVPINASIIMTTNPVLVLVISALLIGERITPIKVGGIFVAAAGALSMHAFGKELSFGNDTLTGDMFILINSCSYAIYLVAVKPLMKKYDGLTVIRWAFTFGLIFTTPFGINPLLNMDWNFSMEVWGSILFIVLFTTFTAYLLNIYALKIVSPTIVSSYIYLQPVLAAIFAFFLREDEITFVQIISAVLIFLGVYLISSKRLSPKSPVQP